MTFWSAGQAAFGPSRTPELRVLMPAFQKLGASIYALTRLRRDEFFDARVAKTFEAFSQNFAKPLNLEPARLLATHQAAVASQNNQARTAAGGDESPLVRAHADASGRWRQTFRR
jgi:hypothetical protein